MRVGSLPCVQPCSDGVHRVEQSILGDPGDAASEELAERHAIRRVTSSGFLKTWDGRDREATARVHVLAGRHSAD